MTDRRMLSKEASDGRPRKSEEEKPSDYYYDDSTGYRIYDRDKENDDDDDDEDDATAEAASYRSLIGSIRESACLMKRFV